MPKNQVARDSLAPRSGPSGFQQSRPGHAHGKIDCLGSTQSRIMIKRACRALSSLECSSELEFGSDAHGGGRGIIHRLCFFLV